MACHDAVFKPAGERHRNTYGPAGARTLLIEMCAPEGELSLPPRPLLLRGDRPGRLASQLYRELGRDGRPSRAVLEDLSWSLVALFVCEHVSPPSAHPWLVRVRERLADQWAAPPTVRELAAEERVHPTHLIRAFGRAFGTSPGGYVRDLRARRALDQIVRTSCPLSRVAAECGFADQSHLCREITRRFGESPSALRRQAASPGPPGPI
jgi:AraC-like DNA-binding protein